MNIEDELVRVPTPKTCEVKAAVLESIRNMIQPSYSTRLDIIFGFYLCIYDDCGGQVAIVTFNRNNRRFLRLIFDSTDIFEVDMAEPDSIERFVVRLKELGFVNDTDQGLRSKDGDPRFRFKNNKVGVLGRV